MKRFKEKLKLYLASNKDVILNKPEVFIDDKYIVVKEGKTLIRIAWQELQFIMYLVILN